MTSTMLDLTDLIALLQGQQLFRDEFGRPVEAPSGSPVKGIHEVAFAFKPSDVLALKTMFTPEAQAIIFTTP
jgi:hypothetical protein